MPWFLVLLLRSSCCVFMLASRSVRRIWRMRSCCIPAPDSWPLYHGDYSGRRHIPLTQITPQNVGDLTLAWAFQTEPERRDQIFAAAGRWNPLLHGARQCLGSRRAVRPHDLALQPPVDRANTSAIAASPCTRAGSIFTTPDAHLISLDAKDGNVRWDKIIADVEKGYWSTMAPLVVKNHVIVGVGGDLDNLPGLSSLVRSGDRRNAVAVGRHASCGHAQHDHRRHDVDDRHLRSRT